MSCRPSVTTRTCTSPIARLDVRERAVVYLTYWDELSTTEIGALLDVHPGTVRRLLARARFQLRKDIS